MNVKTIQQTPANGWNRVSELWTQIYGKRSRCVAPKMPEMNGQKAVTPLSLGVAEICIYEWIKVPIHGKM